MLLQEQQNEVVMRALLVFAVGCLFTVVVGGVPLQRSLPQPGQVPAWPKSGVIPPQFATRYVFYDFDTDEFVLAFPENLGRPEFASNHGALRVYRIPSNRTARAVITFEVVSVQGKYKYAYRVENRIEAKQPIMSWDVVLPDPPDGTITAPPLWRGAATSSDISAIGEALGTPGLRWRPSKVRKLHPITEYIPTR